MFDKWYESMEAEIVRILAVVYSALFFAAIVGTGLLIAIQAVKYLKP